MSATEAAADFIDDRARGEFWRLAVGVFLVSFMNAHSTLLAIVFARNGLDLHAIGVLLSSLAIPVIGFALISGEVTNRIGVLQTLRLAMALTLIGFASFYFTRADFFGSLASRMVQGAGQGLFLTSAIAYGQTRLTPRRFLFLLGIYSATMPLAQAVAPAFGEWTLNAFGDRAMFAISAIPALVGIALTLGVRPIPLGEKRRGLDLIASWRPQMVEALGAITVAGSMFGFAMAYLAPALEQREIPLAAFFTASTLTMFGARTFAFRGVESADRRLLVATGLAFEAAGFVLVAIAGRNVWPVLAGGVLFGIGHSMIYPVLSVWVSEGLEMARRAGPQAWLNAFFNVGLYATPLPMTWLVAGVGYDWTMIILSAICATFALVLALRGVNRGG